jgi:hypothetical protein
MSKPGPKDEAAKDSGALNGTHLNGAADHDESDEAAPEELPEEPVAPPPPEVAELAASCVRYVQAKFGVLLDGTQDTLSLLDAYVQDARKSTVERPESLPLIAASVGAYFGEVVRLAFGASWITVGDHDTWRVCLKYVYLAFNPVTTAVSAITGNDSTEGAHFTLDAEDREYVEARLAALGEVDEDEYVLPTTRFDVLHIAVEAVRARMIERGLADVTFGPDDY